MPQENLVSRDCQAPGLEQPVPSRGFDSAISKAIVYGKSFFILSRRQEFFINYQSHKR